MNWDSFKNAALLSYAKSEGGESISSPTGVVILTKLSKVRKL